MPLRVWQLLLGQHNQPALVTGWCVWLQQQIEALHVIGVRHVHISSWCGHLGPVAQAGRQAGRGGQAWVSSIKPGPVPAGTAPSSAPEHEGHFAFLHNIVRQGPPLLNLSLAATLLLLLLRLSSTVVSSCLGLGLCCLALGASLWGGLGCCPLGCCLAALFGRALYCMLRAFLAAAGGLAVAPWGLCLCLL